ncbi:MAG: aminoglycoside phosphotransferase family protein [Lachnospiraceae bacterium]|nr:aminoglycoside phosphotransferase family protein [Lachnospiraceae bacterium]
MGREEYCSKIDEALRAFDIEGEELSCVPFGNGHINDTFLVITKHEGKEKKYILQRINHEIFKDPAALMENIKKVTDHLKWAILNDGGDIKRETLNIIPTKEGGAFYKDSIGSYWRMYDYIEDAICLDKPDCSKVFYESAVAFGYFQRRLASFDAKLLTETIKDFHNTPKRFEDFMQAVSEDPLKRAAGVMPEIEFLKKRREDMGLCMKYLKENKIPLRVTHNDTKLNNIMIDKESGRGICVIDLDTVMPGLSIFDFGDSIRFGANSAVEDETDLSKVSLDLELFETYVKGFLKGCGGALTDAEAELLPLGAKTMTLECGMRFLTDYLQGDTYFRVHREGHNLDRCRCQLALAKDMERKWDKMADIVRAYSGGRQ